MPIPPMQPHPQQHQQQARSNMPPIPPFAGASQTPPIPEHSRSPPNQQGPPQPTMSSPPPAPVARGSRRQYAANTAAYIAGDTSGVGAPLTNHAHTQSQQFFSPATHDPSSQMFTPGGGPQDFGGAAAAQGFQQPGAPIPPYAGAQQQPGVQGMTSQFGQMGLGGQKPAQIVSTTNLIGQPLNPAEMMTMSPPEIRLPPNVSL